MISTLILLQEVAEVDYLREYHRVGSRPHRDENPELAGLAMDLSPYAFDLVVSELNYATGGRVVYAVHTVSGVARLESLRTSTNHTINIKVRMSFLYKMCSFSVSYVVTLILVYSSVVVCVRLHLQTDIASTVPPRHVLSPVNPERNCATSIQLYYSAVDERVCSQ